MGEITPIRKLYQPSTGTEGAMFIETWCTHCARDKAMREGAPIEECDDNEVCRIIGKTFAHNITDPEYPAEWCYDKNGHPQCTAFIPEGTPLPTARELEAAGQMRLSL